VVSIADSRLARAALYARGHGVTVGRELAVNFLLPFLIYRYANESVGAVLGLIAASAPPILWAIVVFVRERRVDAISIMAVSGITLSLLAFSGGGGIKMLQLRENLVTGLVGLVFLGSAAIGRPLIYRLAVAGVRRRAPEKVQAVEILHGDVQFLRSMTVATLVWGFGLLAACALNCTLVFMVSIQHFLLMHGPINYATIGLMTAWTFWYVPRAMRLAAARLLGAQQGKPAA
jgi:hypothetical protein